MARFSFETWIEDRDTGKTFLDKTITADQLSVYRDGTLISRNDADLVVNGDGTVFGSLSGSGQIRVHLNGAKQREFFNSYILDDDAIYYPDKVNINHLGINAEGRLQLSGSVMSSSAVGDTVMSVQKALHLIRSSSALEIADDSILKQYHIVNDFTSSVSSSQVQSAESLKMSFSGSGFLSGSLSIRDAVLTIDRNLGKWEVENIKLAGGALYNRGTFLLYDTSDAFMEQSSQGEYFIPTANSALFYSTQSAWLVPESGVVKAWTIEYVIGASFTSTNAELEAGIFTMNPSDLTTYDYTKVASIDLSNESGHSGSVAFVDNYIPFESGSLVGVKLQVTESAGDDLRIDDIVSLVEIQYQVTSSLEASRRVIYNTFKLQQ